ncbi:MAG: hydrogenase expression/formation protein HypE [Planctomycetes bacterium]|nr:hydrogenase expression/formation protein HypE [Planctomycetota bacterium]
MSDESSRDFQPSCPLPLSDHATVQMAHGGGGRVMQQLIEGLFLPEFALGEGEPRVNLSPPHDSAVLELGGTRLAFTTDTFVVSPLFFPGGDIGRLAVYGTVNDLAMAGARPVALSAGVILEEGFPMETLGRIVHSMGQTAREVGVPIVTGDTKVVDRGKGDGIFINTAGIGLIPPGVSISPEHVSPGDAVIVSGDLGRHGIAIMSVREGLAFEGALQSDCASLAAMVESLVAAASDVHCLRDLTRGGLAAALNEIAGSAGVGIELHEASIPVAEPVAAACELLGLDPLYTANEGRLVAFVPPEAADRALEVMRQHSAAEPAVIGTVTDHHPGCVEVVGLLGGRRIIDLLSGEQMPRIC